MRGGNSAESVWKFGVSSCDAAPTGPPRRRRLRCRPGRSAAAAAGTACRRPAAARRNRSKVRRGQAGPSFVRAAPRSRLRPRQGERARVVAAGELDQRFDAALDRRVGGEQVGETRARVVDAHFHDRRGRAFELAAAFDLAQRRDHGVGVLGQLDRAGVGEIFAFSRQREADHDRQQPGDRDQHDRDDDRDRGAAALAAVAARQLLPPSGSRPGTSAGTRSSAKNEITPAMITAITSMRTSPLRIWVSSWPSTASSSASSSAVEQAGGDGDRVLLLVHPGGEGVERVVLHHLELRHRDAARDAKVLQQIVEPRLLLPGDLASAGDRVDHRLVELVGDEDPQSRADGRERQRIEEVAQRRTQR